MPPFTIPTTSAADELEYLWELRAERALAVARPEMPIWSATSTSTSRPRTDAYVGLAVTEIASLRGEIGARDQG